ncbi:hypothetical protein MMPV_005706 [Pyropia vietnamensis]
MDNSRGRGGPPPSVGGSGVHPSAPAPIRYPGAAGTTASLTVEQLKLLGCIVPAMPAGTTAASTVRQSGSSGGLGSLAATAPAMGEMGGASGGGGSDAGGGGGGGVGASHPRRRPTRDLSAFDRLEQVGEGAYGEVFMAREVATGDRVALKRVRMDAEREGLPVTAVREIKLLLSLRHENVVCLKEIVTSPKKALAGAPGGAAGKDDIYMVFEYMDHDLTGLLESPSVRFTEAQVKRYARQLLRGLWYCHARELLHRDIKGSNLLVDNAGNLKIADFGLARTYGEAGRGDYTNRVITLWYRPPELLLGARDYGPAVDLWSVGCLLYELLRREPLFPGSDEADQVARIFSATGVPTEEAWPGWRRLELSHMVNEAALPTTGAGLRKRLRECGEGGAADLIAKLLALDPSARLTADEALDHDWFWTPPMPAEAADLPVYASAHEYQTKQRAREAKERAAGRGGGGGGVGGSSGWGGEGKGAAAWGEDAVEGVAAVAAAAAGA